MFFNWITDYKPFGNKQAYDGILWIIWRSRNRVVDPLSLGPGLYSQSLLSPLCQSAFQRNSCSLMSVQPGLSSSLCHYPAVTLDISLNLGGPIPALKCSPFITWQSQHLLVICVKQEQLCRRKWSKHLLLEITFDKEVCFCSMQLSQFCIQETHK